MSGDVTTEAMHDEAMHDAAPEQGPSGVVGIVAWVVGLLLGLFFLPLPFHAPWTSAEGFSSDAVPTVNDEGDIDCGGSSLRVVLHGPRVAIPPGDLARRAEKACRDDAKINVVFGGVVAPALVVLSGSMLVRRARRDRARRRTAAEERAALALRVAKLEEERAALALRVAELEQDACGGRRRRRRAEAEEPGDSCDGMGADVGLSENGTFVGPRVTR